MYIHGYKIKKEREKQGIKQLTLAEAVNVSQSWLSKVESGLSEPDSNKLEEIAQYLNVPVQNFIKEGFSIEYQNTTEKANGIFLESENNNINNLNKLIDRLENMINQKDNIIVILQNEIISLKEKIERRNKKIEEQKEQINKLIK
jgi:transcriptional regulator with XRE-family HTH domain